MGEGFDDKKTLTSEFNEAGFQIQRLNNLWVMCNLFSIKGDIEQLKWILDRAWVELSPDAKLKDKGKEEKDTYFFKVNELNKKIAKAITRDDLYKTLQEKEIFLRCLQEAVGKGSKKTQQYERIM